MTIFDKAKQLTDKVTEGVTNFSSDEAIANTVIRAVEKQEKVNKILKEKGCNYLIADIELGMSIPPSVSFGVRRVDEMQAESSAELAEREKT
jgi:hypothetical protein